MRDILPKAQQPTNKVTLKGPHRGPGSKLAKLIGGPHAVKLGVDGDQDLRSGREKALFTTKAKVPSWGVGPKVPNLLASA